MAIVRDDAISKGIAIEVHACEDGESQYMLTFTESDLRGLYFWFDKVLRLEDHRGAHQLRNFIGEAVHVQAWLLGYKEAGTADEPTVSNNSTPIWRDAYLEGWATRKSEKAGTL